MGDIVAWKPTIAIDFDSEEWRVIVGWPYEVSSFGRVRRAVPENNTWAGRILKPNVDRYGYQYVRLSSNGIVKDFKVHRLVCEGWHGPCPVDKNQVRHLNGDSKDNRQDNLMWGTAADNAKDRDLHGTTLRGETAVRAIFSQECVDILRKEYETEVERRRSTGFVRVERGFKQSMARKYDININTLSAILASRGYLWLGNQQ
jgi:hypothetical protein